MRLELSLLFFFVIYVAFANRNIPTSPVQPRKNYENEKPDPRLRFLFYRPWTTITTTTTSTSTATCTKSVANPCAGRKRRGTLIDEDEEEQFLISPTVVQGSETTQEPIREPRQLLMYPPELAQYHPQSGINQYYSYVPLENYYNQFNAEQPTPRSRLFVGMLRNFLSVYITTFIATETLFTVKTSTSIPDCSITGIYPQCPYYSG